MSWNGSSDNSCVFCQEYFLTIHLLYCFAPTHLACSSLCHHFFFFFYFSLFIYSGTHLRQSSWEQQECFFFFNRALLGGSGGVVNSLDFCPASLKSLGCFYFRCILSSQWKAVTVNLRILHCQLYVSGNKQ